MTTGLDVHEIRHGYNLADLDQLARTSLWRRWATNLPYQDGYDIAWSAIAEHLYATNERPEPNELLAAARTALSEAVYAEWHHRGYDYNKRDGIMPRYAAYWTGGRATPDPGPAIVDRAALWQIWPHLTELQRKALLALATHEDYRLAAAAMGMSYGAFKQRVGQARRTFLALWHEGEAPSRMWGTDRRQGSKDRSVTSVLAARERQRRARVEAAA